MYIQAPNGRRSWHLIASWTRVPNQARVWCGRRINGESSDTFPEGERTCESCFRRKAKAEGA